MFYYNVYPLYHLVNLDETFLKNDIKKKIKRKNSRQQGDLQKYSPSAGIKETRIRATVCFPSGQLEEL